jgi:hypothetical protein
VVANAILDLLLPNAIVRRQFARHPNGKVEMGGHTVRRLAAQGGEDSFASGHGIAADYTHSAEDSTNALPCPSAWPVSHHRKRLLVARSQCPSLRNLPSL